MIDKPVPEPARALYWHDVDRQTIVFINTSTPAPREGLPIRDTAWPVLTAGFHAGFTLKSEFQPLQFQRFHAMTTDIPKTWNPPAGLRIERPAWEPDCAMIGNDETGWVTVDLKRRVCGPGYARPAWFALPGGTYQGAGWKRRLLDDAVKHLLESSK